MTAGIKTIEELNSQDKVFFDEIARYLENCVAEDLDIPAEAVIQLIERCEPLSNPNQEEMWTVLEVLLTKGMSDHFLDFREMPAAGYRIVIHHIKGKIKANQAEVI